MIKYVSPPNLLIYLRANISTLVKQIGERGRVFEEKIKIEYLKNLNNFYEKWISNYSLGKLLIIDVNKLDFINEVDDFAFIVDKIDLELHGLFSSP